MRRNVISPLFALALRRIDMNVYVGYQVFGWYVKERGGRSWEGERGRSSGTWLDIKYGPRPRTETPHYAQRKKVKNMAAAASKKEETDVVGDQRNWEQRVTSELEVAKAWCESWGPLYEGAQTQQQQAAALEEKLKRMPGDQGTKTNYQLSFTGEPPFAEYPVGPTQKKLVRMEDVEELAREMMAAQHREKQRTDSR